MRGGPPNRATQLLRLPEVVWRPPEWVPQLQFAGGVLASFIGPSGALTHAQGLSLDWHRSDPCSSGTIQAFCGSRLVFQGGSDQVPIYRFQSKRESRSFHILYSPIHPSWVPPEQEPFSVDKFSLDRLRAWQGTNRFGTSKVPLYRRGPRNVATSRSLQGAREARESPSASSWPA